jgi:hypothetical protein
MPPQGREREGGRQRECEGSTEMDGRRGHSEGAYLTGKSGSMGQCHFMGLN